MVSSLTMCNLFWPYNSTIYRVSSILNTTPLNQNQIWLLSLLCKDSFENQGFSHWRVWARLFDPQTAAMETGSTIFQLVHPWVTSPFINMGITETSQCSGIAKWWMTDCNQGMNEVTESVWNSGMGCEGRLGSEVFGMRSGVWDVVFTISQAENWNWW